jgi:NTP pyrophosphatase (non-canonical NTP hydrolase)
VDLTDYKGTGENDLKLAKEKIGDLLIVVCIHLEISYSEKAKY